MNDIKCKETVKNIKIQFLKKDKKDFFKKSKLRKSIYDLSLVTNRRRKSTTPCIYVLSMLILWTLKRSTYAQAGGWQPKAAWHTLVRERRSLSPEG